MDTIQSNFKNICFSIQYDSNEISVKSSESDLISYLEQRDFYDSFKQLQKIKSSIDIMDEKEWDYLKKKSNPFECVTTNGGIANYTPISRAYFKMFEMIYLYKKEIDVLLEEKEIETLHLAEGPGGFIECINEYVTNQGNKIDLYGITLLKEDKMIPAWKKSLFFLEMHPNIHILRGKDGTGDLYNVENLYDIMSQLKKKASIITGDGGFDFSNDFNEQEKMSFPLIYCQTMSAFMNQKEGGIFILKIFDMYELKTLCLIHLLTKHYKKVDIVKPYTSRPANSEKYLVCNGYLGLMKDIELYRLLCDIGKLGNNQIMELELFKYVPLQSSFYDCIQEMNQVFFERQRDFILNTIELKNEVMMEEKKNELLKNQILTSVQWCLKYKFKINYLSKFIAIYNLYKLKN